MTSFLLTDEKQPLNQGPSVSTRPGKIFASLAMFFLLFSTKQTETAKFKIRIWRPPSPPEPGFFVRVNNKKKENYSDTAFALFFPI